MSNTEDVKIVILNFDSLEKNKKILSYEDFYKETHITEFLENLANASSYKKYHYANVQANEDTIKKIDNLIENNLINTKNKYSKMYKTLYLKSVRAMDSLIWSPKINNKVDSDIIKIILPNNKEFITVTEKDL